VESEYTSEKLVLFAICAKNFHNRSKFGKVLTKNKFAHFFETRCRPQYSKKADGDILMSA